MFKKNDKVRVKSTGQKALVLEDPYSEDALVCVRVEGQDGESYESPENLELVESADSQGVSDYSSARNTRDFRCFSFLGLLRFLCSVSSCKSV
jgi:hypothetical protein